MKYNENYQTKKRPALTVVRKNRHNAFVAVDDLSINPTIGTGGVYTLSPQPTAPPVSSVPVTGEINKQFDPMKEPAPVQQPEQKLAPDVDNHAEGFRILIYLLMVIGVIVLFAYAYKKP